MDSEALVLILVAEGTGLILRLGFGGGEGPFSEGHML